MGVPNRMDIGQAGDNNPDSANEAPPRCRLKERPALPRSQRGCKTVKGLTGCFVPSNSPVSQSDNVGVCPGFPVTGIDGVGHRRADPSVRDFTAKGSILFLLRVLWGKRVNKSGPTGLSLVSCETGLFYSGMDFFAPGILPPG